jgi:hypothetical protein
MLAGLLNVSIMWLLTGRGEGVAAPGDEGVPKDIDGILTDIRLMRAEMGRMADRLGLLEKRLRQTTREASV